MLVFYEVLCLTLELVSLNPHHTVGSLFLVVIDITSVTAPESNCLCAFATSEAISGQASYASDIYFLACCWHLEGGSFSSLSLSISTKLLNSSFACLFLIL